MALGLVMAMLPVGGASAQITVSERERVLGEIDHQAFTVTLSGGVIARGNVTSYPEGSPTVELRPRLAQGTIAGLQRFATMAANEVDRGAVVGTNGGYWLPRPSGAPNGLHIERGRLLSGDASGFYGGHSSRGMLGIQAGGRLVMDRLLTTLTLGLPEGPSIEAVPFDEINRQVGGSSDPDRVSAGELLVFDDRFGTAIQVPAGSTVLTIEGLQLASSGRAQGTIAAQRVVPELTAISVPQSSHVVVAYGNRLPTLDGAEVGHRVVVTTTIAPYNSPSSNWDELSAGLAGGQLLVQDGVRRTLDEWRTQNFGESHVTGRQPRTAIGRTADGRVLMVTVDGRQNGWSSGMTVSELADTMLALGAVDALNLDGGGSTTMTIDGHIVNRPSEVGRSVATGLFVYVERPAGARNLDRACPAGVVPGTPFTDVAGTTHVASIDCLAWWGVTKGATATTFAPNDDVTRAQMASFLARWIDDLAARGEGRALPAAATLGFADVSLTSVHAPAIARLADAGIIGGRTATTYEPAVSVSRAQTAALVRRSIEYVAGTQLPAGRDTFVDDNGSTHELNIDALADVAVGVIAGVGGFSYRPTAPVSRGAMASLLMRASDLAIERELTAVPS